MGFHFAQLLVFDQALKSRSAAVRASLLSEMVRLSAAILHLAMDTADDRTRHLTDHIYQYVQCPFSFCALSEDRSLKTRLRIPGLEITFKSFANFILVSSHLLPSRFAGCYTCTKINSRLRTIY